MSAFRKIFFHQPTRRSRRLSFGGDQLESRVLLSAVTVSTGADSGPGSLRDAIEQANTDPSVDKIVIQDSVGEIEIESTIEYTGSQSLNINGNGATIAPVAGQEQQFNLFASTGDADLSLNNLNLRDGLNGIFVPVSGSATGTLSFEAKNLSVTGSSLFGLHIADQINDSDASISLTLNNSSFTNNGIGELDFDGVRVDEGGLGDITSVIKNSTIDGNGGDGLELDERGAGSVYLTVNQSTFDGNGFFNEEDLDDGLDIDEADAGGIYASVRNTSLSGNFDEGLDLDEAGEGDVELEILNVVASDNIDEGVKLDEEDDGSIWLNFRNLAANNSADEEGVAISEVGAGSLTAFMKNVTANDNDNEGIDLSEEDEGDFWGDFANIEVIGNGNDGLQLEEAGIGSFDVSMKRLFSAQNDGFGLKVAQETVGSDFGLLSLKNVDLFDNIDGDIDEDGVILT